MAEHKNPEAGTASGSAVQEQPEVKVVFNPFTVLSVEQTAALVTRLNPQWKETQADAIKTAAAEHKIDDATATILVWLSTTANDALESRQLSAKLTSCKSLLQNVAAGSLATLAIIAEDYKSLPASTLRAYRIGVRDAIMKQWIGETARRIMEKVMECTGVFPESAWMR